jgi:hypothetical protein
VILALAIAAAVGLIGVAIVIQKALPRTSRTVRTATRPSNAHRTDARSRRSLWAAVVSSVRQPR